MCGCAHDLVLLRDLFETHKHSMARANTLQTNFTAGEISPLMWGRVDVNKYFNGARKLQNVIVRPQGGAWRRSGTRFVKSTKTSSTQSILQSFIFSDIQAYVLEFGDGYMRVYKDRGYIETSPGSGVQVEIATPWAAADLALLYFTQSADVLYVSHPLYQTRKISRTSHTSWSISLYSPIDGPYLSVDQTGTRLQVLNIIDTANLTQTLTGTGYTLTASGGTPFVIGNIGKYVEFKDAYGRWTLAIVTAFTDSTHVTVDLVPVTSIIYTSDTIDISGGQLRDVSGHKIFTTANVGCFVRETAAQVWHTQTGVVGPSPSTNATQTTLSIVSYTNPVILTLSNGPFISGDIGKYIEYKDNEVWKLALIKGVLVGGNTAMVDVVDQIFFPNIGANITFSSASIISDLSGIFAPRPGKNMHIRTTDTQLWYKMSAYVNTTKWSATLDTMKSYTYPQVTVVITNRVITASVSASAPTFAATDVGRWLRMQFGAQVRAMQITSFISETLVNVTVSSPSGDPDLTLDFPRDDTNADNLYNNGFADSFQLGAWSDTTGWPSVLTFHEQRLFFGRTNTQPQTVWGSRSGDYENMSPTELDLSVVEDNAVNYTIASNQANPIVWMETGPVLMIGTIGSEHQIKATTLNSPITPTNIDVRQQTTFGSQPGHRLPRLGNCFLFLQRGGNKLREMTYNFYVDSYESKDLNILGEHILRRGSGGVKSTFQKEPTMVVWMILTDGSLAAMTYEKDQEVVAWTHHIIGGPATGAIVESICSVPNSSGSVNDVYVIVNRTINGSTARYVEYIESPFDTDVSGTTKSDMFFVDCGLTYSGSPATVISGLTHLIGETVQILADGVYVGTKVVSGGGTITLTTAASKVHVGYKSTAAIVTMDPEGGSQAGTSQGKVKRITQLGVRMKDTLPFKHGPDEQHLIKVNQEDFTTMTTGDVRFSLDQGFDLTASYCVVQDEPVALNITAFMPQLNTNE